MEVEAIHRKATVVSPSNPMAGADPLVSILIVTYQSGFFIRLCLESVFCNTLYPAYEVVAVDNGSTDGSLKTLRDFAAAAPRMRVVASPRNLGFAGGNNVAARRARGRFLVLLNADTIVTEGWLKRLVRHAQADPAAGILSAVTNFSCNETQVDCDYRNAQELKSHAARLARERAGQIYPLKMVPLFCALIPKDVWVDVGELDERFLFGTCEDDDYSLRVLRAGYRLGAVEDSFVHHFGSVSINQLGAAESAQLWRNSERFQEKWGRGFPAKRRRPETRRHYGHHLPVTAFSTR